MFDNIRGDFNAHGRRWGAQGFWVMCVYRFGRWRYRVKPILLRKLFSALYHVVYKLVQILTGIELPCEVELGRNFVIDHFGGIVISGYAKFGDDCRLRNGVVVGLARLEHPVAPRIGNRVDIGAGAVVCGGIRIGHDSVIGANAVVLKDVPPYSVVVGIPGKVIKTLEPKEEKPSPQPFAAPIPRDEAA